MKYKSTEIMDFLKSKMKGADDFDSNFDDGEAWTSFERIEITLAAEEEFEIQFSQEELAMLISPRDVYEAIASALSQQSKLAEI